MRNFLVWGMRVLLAAFCALALFGAWVVASGNAWGQGVGVGPPGPGPGPGPGLVVVPNYGEGATARWWIRTQAPELVVLVAPVLNGAAGCYMAIGLPPPPAPPQVYTYNNATGDWLGDGEVCRARVEGVRGEDGGGVRLQVEFGGKWVGGGGPGPGPGGGAGRQTVWVMERGGGSGGWVRAGVWVVGEDAAGVEWVQGEPIPLPPPPPTPAPPLPLPRPVVSVTRVVDTTAVFIRPGCFLVLNGIVQSPKTDYPPSPPGDRFAWPRVLSAEDLLIDVCVWILGGEANGNGK